MEGWATSEIMEIPTASVLVVMKGNLQPSNTIALVIKVHLKDPPVKLRNAKNLTESLFVS